jgi:hypothetical protein
MVFVEAGADNPWRLTADGTLVRSSDLTTGQPIPPMKTSGPLRANDIPSAALAQMRAGVAELSRSPMDRRATGCRLRRSACGPGRSDSWGMLRRR